MKRMDRSMVRGPLYKQFDMERKTARQAEARLSLRLQRLDIICLYHVKSLAREERQLQKELQRLQQANIIKKKFSSYVQNGIQKRSKDVVTFSPQTGQRHSVPEPKTRALKTNITQEVKTKIQVTSLPDTALKDALRGQEHMESQHDRSSCCKEGNSQGRERESENPLKGTDPRDVSVPWHDQEVPTNKTEDSRCVSSPGGESQSAPADETGLKNASRKLHGAAGAQSLPSSEEYPGSFKGERTKPTFLELFTKAKNAHYLRHRVPPESERMLSIREIFGHSDPSLPRVGKHP